MESIIDYFNKFSSLSAEAQNLVQGVFKEVKYPKGKILVVEGRQNSFYYLIKKGIARGFYTVDGKELTCTLWMENETFGDITTYITAQPASKSYQLLEDSTLLRINIAEFRALFDLNYEICNLGRIFAERYILGVEASQIRDRGLSAHEKYALFLSNRPGLIYRVRFIYIASYLKMAPETLSRIHSEQLRYKQPKSPLLS